MIKYRGTRWFKFLKRHTERVRFWSLVILDANRYYRSNFFANRSRKTQDNLRGEIAFYSHAIEKGLIHREFRPLFGKSKLMYMLDLLEEYTEKGYSLSDSRFVSAVNVIRDYCEVHVKLGFNDQISWITDRLSQFEAIPSTTVGALTLKRSDVLKHVKGSFSDLSNWRHSVRDFAAGDFDESRVEEALRISERTPSVCNRQAWKVYISKRALKQPILDIQGGIGGMAHGVAEVAVITMDNQYFGNVTERNQAFVDGGLFSMTFLYALAEQGVAACPLNADFNNRNDLRMRKLLNIPYQESIIMVIAMGNYSEESKVPVSLRDSYQHFTKVVD
ncbi:nitroreductase family protein [Lacticaseibacillus suibinensis]|uniref:nitroreductase family protein n=1 Tax=Lacticaseibacillus suibinensis TaxID=2486011 RepID=UPI001943C21D|nr:nitroreductase family protein [Lacticaseibacillus suibinensis]